MNSVSFSPDDDRPAMDPEGQPEVVPDEDRPLDEPDPAPGDVPDEDRPVVIDD